MLLFQNLNSFRKLLSLIVILTLGSIFTQKLYAQDPMLFEHTWYLEKVFNGEDDFYLADYTFATGTTEFFETAPYFYVFLCDIHWFTSEIAYLPNNEPGFTLSYIEYCPFPYQCDEEISNYIDFNIIRSIFFSVFYDQDYTDVQNPFSYTLTQNGNEAKLIIENEAGMKAYYYSFPLSVQEQMLNDILIYPNPVSEKLFIKSSNGSLPQSLKIYNLSGVVISQVILENTTTELSLDKVKPGIYFVVIEDETGKRVTRKIIKK